MNNQHDPARENLVMTMVADGYCLEDIRDAVGYSSTMCVRGFLRNKGIKHVPKTRARIEKDARNREIVRLREEGFKHSEIAELVGVNTPVVSAVLRDAGLHGHKKDVLQKTCRFCGKRFYTTNEQKLYCSDKCQRGSWKNNGNVKTWEIRRRSKMRSAIIDHDITLEKVVEKYNGICSICGKPTDWDDVVFVNGKKYASRLYPSIDHIVPISKGGEHAWHNIQLAHISCNAAKGARHE